MGFVSIGSVIGFENSRHHEHQSHVKLKSCAKLLLLWIGFYGDKKSAFAVSGQFVRLS